jgi:release factor glutamine methyltransferase
VKTYNDVYIEARRALRAAGIEACGTEARILLAAAADKRVEDFLRDIRLYPGGDFEARAEEYIRRRLAGEPAAYIAGSWEFCGLELEINSNVLIPRSDTEVVTEAAVSFLRSRPGARVLDLCTGSGCIGLAVAAAVPDCRVVLADIDRRCLLLAKRNALRLKLSQRVMAVEADALAPPARQLGHFDLIVSNPPYVPTGEVEELEPSVRDYEPLTALDGGADGLDFYRSIFTCWTVILKPGGCLALECGEGQSQALLRFGRQAGLEPEAILKDTGGTERALSFRRPEEASESEENNESETI